MTPDIKEGKPAVKRRDFLKVLGVSTAATGSVRIGRGPEGGRDGFVDSDACLA